MHRLELLLGRGLDHFTDADNVARFIRTELDAKGSGIVDHIEHPAVRDIDGHRSKIRNFNGSVEMHGERRDILERHARD